MGFFAPEVYYETHGGKLTASTSAPIFNRREKNPEHTGKLEILLISYLAANHAKIMISKTYNQQCNLGASFQQDCVDTWELRLISVKFSSCKCSFQHQLIVADVGPRPQVCPSPAVCKSLSHNLKLLFTCWTSIPVNPAFFTLQHSLKKGCTEHSPLNYATVGCLYCFILKWKVLLLISYITAECFHPESGSLSFKPYFVWIPDFSVKTQASNFQVV